jgi:sortase A
MTGRSDVATDERRTARRADRAQRRHARWDRPKPPKDWRYFVGGLGRVLIVVGLLMFGFVAYQLWGTGLEYAQAQNRLDDELDDLFAGITDPVTVGPTTIATAVAPTTSAPSTGAGAGSTPAPTAVAPTTAAATTTTTTTAGGAAPVPVATIPPPAFQTGDAMARIEIPRIGLDAVVVAGVEPSDLKQGPGHYPGTPMPGQLGNSAIAGHRTTYGQPFFDLDDVEPGDEIVLTSVQGRFVYRMTGSEIVSPSAGHVVLTTDPNVARLTLTTCEPKYTATNRLIVYAELDTAASGPGLPPVLDYGGGQPAPDGSLPGEPAVTTIPLDPAVAAGSTPAGSAVASTPPPAAAAPDTGPGASVPGALASGEAGPGTTIGGEVTAAAASDDASGDPLVVDAFSQGWFHDTAAWPHVIGWGLVVAAIAAAGYFVARALRRYWAGFAVAAVPFVVALYFFYQNVNRLLPAAI